MRLPDLVLGFVLLSTVGALAQPSLVERLVPRPPNQDEALWVRIDAGALPPRARVRLSTADGVLIGGAAPFGGPRRQAGATYDFALPENTIENGRVRLRVEVVEPDGSSRPPQPDEIDVTLRYVPVTPGPAKARGTARP